MIRTLLRAVANAAEGRSPRWPAVRKAHLKQFPHCEACGGKAEEVHHVEPFHVRPDLELDPANLISVCRTDHFVFAHLHSWKSHNPSVREDAATFLQKVRTRP